MKKILIAFLLFAAFYYGDAQEIERVVASYHPDFQKTFIFIGFSKEIPTSEKILIRILRPESDYVFDQEVFGSGKREGHYVLDTPNLQPGNYTVVAIFRNIPDGAGFRVEPAKME